MSSKIKNTVRAFGIFLLFIGLGFNRVQAHPRQNISLQVFYDELSYYGDWINNPQYGYVWRPDVGRDFRPYYTNGHWVMTEYGNTWVSDYDWGWAAFHYGRWFYDDYDGWVWMPDTEWGPAWVSWRTGGGYYGWAPLGPRINISINIGNVYIPDNYWVFIPQRCIYYPSYYRFWEPRRNVYIIHNTTYINNVYVNRNTRFYSGRRIDDVRRATRSNVPVYRIADDSRPGSSRVTRDAVNIYRPDVRKEDSRNAAPRTIASNNGRPTRDSDGINRSNSSSQRPDVSNRPSNGRPDMSDRASRSSDNGNVDRGTQRPDMSNRPSNGRPDVSERSGRSDSGNADRGTQRPDMSKGPERVERSSPPASQRPVDDSRSRENTPSRSETSRESSRPQRVERSQPTQSAPRQVERVERSSSSSRESSSRGSENSKSKSSNGRPTRGN